MIPEINSEFRKKDIFSSGPSFFSKAHTKVLCSPSLFFELHTNGDGHVQE